MIEGGERDLVLQIVGSLNVGIWGGVLTSVVVVVVVHLGALCVDWYTSGHFLCATTTCVHGVVPVPVNSFFRAAGGLCCCLSQP